MTRPALELADIVRQCGERLRRTQRPSLAQQRVLRDVAACRTAELGGHVQACNGCDHRQIAYNSCRNRHCPKCQAAARAEWMAAREQELLPVPYFHLVFTLPQPLNALALQNKKLVYGLLFRAAADTLLTIATDPKHLGAKIGFLAVLHTWGQNLMHHPHLHIVIPGGGLSPDESKWVPCKRSGRGKEFFLPVRILSRVFRGKFIAGLKRAYARGELEFHGKLQPLQNPCEFEQLLDQAVRTDWVVYAKRPFGGPRQVLKYLARYTHRVAISNHRLVQLKNGRVTFRYKDYADGQQAKTMTLEATEFLRRFLLHVLPRGFVRIRHYGLLSNRDRTNKLNQCRERLGVSTPHETSEQGAPVDHAPVEQDVDQTQPCPKCETGRLIVIELVPATRKRRLRRPHFLSVTGRSPQPVDTS
jgi:hypothetical protein